MGGQIVMELCRLYPLRVQGIVLAATFPQSETSTGKQQRLAAADRLQQQGMAAYAADVLPKMLAARSIETAPDIARHVLSMMRSAPPPAGAAAALRGRAERPDCPALIIAGDEDPFTTRHEAERMHALVKGSRLLWLSGTGHMPNLEQPEAFNAALADFLDQFSRRRSSPAARGAP
ncbi:MAG TPA: alpha/beta hydrolase [Steroidobacteraceae bacterium]|jgi:pimeloyl-ACP methyl ester carboxylesterase